MYQHNSIACCHPEEIPDKEAEEEDPQPLRTSANSVIFVTVLPSEGYNTHHRLFILVEGNSHETEERRSVPDLP